MHNAQWSGQSYWLALPVFLDFQDRRRRVPNLLRRGGATGLGGCRSYPTLSVQRSPCAAGCRTSIGGNDENSAAGRRRHITEFFTIWTTWIILNNHLDLFRTILKYGLEL